MASGTRLGQLLRYHRKKALLKQKELAELIAYDATALSRIERDKRVPSPALLEAIIQALQLSTVERQEIWILYLQAVAHEPKPPIDLGDISGLVAATEPPSPTFEELSWADWRELGLQISRQRMATGRHKYWPELYLPRASVQRAFDQFLESDRRCLVLLGRAGVGKSNSLLALAEAQNQTRPELCVLIYNGATLPAQSQLAELIAGDVAAQLKLDGTPAAAVWSALSQAGGNEGRQVIVGVDAVNEHRQPRTLLRQLDELIRQTLSWLKLVCASRPETWNQIVGSNSLAETFSREANQAGTVVIHLDPFTSGELPQVYARYQQVFNLQTAYEVLSGPVREIVRDPLSLLLVAGIFRDRVVPADLPVARLIDEYLQALVRTKRLDQADVSWLVEELMPLMLREGYCSNTVLLSYLQPGGQRDDVNQSLTRLLDTDILVKTGHGPTQQVAFKYERFYDYFAGQRIQALAAAASQRWVIYGEFISYLPAHLYLWGAIQSALQTELREQQIDLIEYLAAQNLPLTGELMAETLSALNQTDSSTAAGLIETMAAHSQPPVRKMAVTVAGRLELEPVLIQAGQDADQEIKWTAAYQTYLLWQDQPALGWRILTTWAGQSGWRFKWPPAGQNLEVCLILSALMMTDWRQSTTQRQATRQKLRRIWQDILGDLLLIDRAISEYPLTRLLRRILIWRLGLYFGHWAGSSRGGQLVAELFPLPPDRRATYLELMDCFELTYEELTSREGLLVEILSWNDLPSVYIVALLLIMKLPHHGDQGLSFFRRLFQRTLHPERPLICSGSLITILYVIVNRQPDTLSNEALALYRTMAKEHFDQTWGLYYTRTGQIDRHYGLDGFSIIDWRKNRTPKPELLIYALEKTIAERPPHSQFILEGLLKDTFQLIYLAALPQLALGAVEVVLQHDQIWRNDERIRESLISCLAGLRLYAPQELETLLNRYEVPQAMKTLIQGRAVTEDLWRRILFPKIMLFLTEILPEPGVQQLLVEALKAILDYDNPERWFPVLLHKTINLIYGKPII